MRRRLAGAGMAVALVAAGWWMLRAGGVGVDPTHSTADPVPAGVETLELAQSDQPPNGAGGPRVLPSREGLERAVATLTDAGLLEDVPEAVALLTELRPDGSVIEARFSELIINPSGEAAAAFQDAVDEEITARALARNRPDLPARDEISEPERRLLLRSILAAEYVRACGGLDERGIDEGLIDAFDNVHSVFADQADLRMVATRMLESRLSETSGDETSWARMTNEQAATTPESELQRIDARRRLLANAAEAAALEGRAADLEMYAARFRPLLGERSPGRRAWRSRGQDYFIQGWRDDLRASQEAELRLER